MTERPDELAPENVNNEQQDAESQAQSVAGEALTKSTSVLGLEDSEKPKGGLEPMDAPDLVDHIKQMETSGTIDMSAYSGEDTMDDLENRYGREGAPDEEFKDDDS